VREREVRAFVFYARLGERHSATSRDALYL